MRSRRSFSGSNAILSFEIARAISLCRERGQHSTGWRRQIDKQTNKQAKRQTDRQRRERDYTLRLSSKSLSSSSRLASPNAPVPSSGSSIAPSTSTDEADAEKPFSSFAFWKNLEKGQRRERERWTYSMRALPRPCAAGLSHLNLPLLLTDCPDLSADSPTAFLAIFLIENIFISLPAPAFFGVLRRKKERKSQGERDR
jgi:hypothetical protein